MMPLQQLVHSAYKVAGGSAFTDVGSAVAVQGSAVCTAGSAVTAVGT